MIKINTIIIILAAFFCSRHLAAQDRVTDSLALVAFYNATGGDNWTNNSNWLTGPLDSWFGVTVSSGRVTELEIFGENNLTGNLPPEIGDLTALTNLDIVSQNGLTGALPTEIGNLTALTFLRFFDCELSGTLPPEIGNLTNLQTLELTANQFSEIPIEIGNLTNLEFLSLSSNQFTGEIPVEIGNLTNLEFLFLNDNQLSGGIPVEIGNLVNLIQLLLNNNQFSALPDLSGLSGLEQSGQDGNTSLTADFNNLTFDDLLPNQGITGAILTPQNPFGDFAPVFFNPGQELTIDLGIDASVTGSSYTWLRDGTEVATTTTNTLTIANAQPSDAGTYTVEVTNTALPDVTLTSNPISVLLDPIVTDSLALVAFYNATGGDNWTDNSNWLTGPLDSWFGVTVSSGRVTRLDFDNGNNNLNGNLTPEIGDLTALTTLNIRTEDALTGALPSEIGNLTALTFLQFFDCELSGTLPPEIGNLTNLEALSLSRNQLSEEIPVEIGNLANLEFLSLDNNQFSGEIPVEIGNLTNLQSLFLDDNQFSGEIPVEIGNLVNLRELFMDNNQFSTLPDLSGLSGLEQSGQDGNTSLTADFNNLTFDDLLPNQGITGAILTPQNPFGDFAPISLNPGQELTIDLGIDGGVTGSSYTWFRDGTEVATTTTNTLTIANAQPSDAGTYIVEVTNTALPDVTLTSNPISVTIPDADPPVLNLVAAPQTYTLGTEGATVSVRASDEGSGVASVALLWKQAATITSDTSEFEAIPLSPSQTDNSLFEFTFSDSDFDNIGVQYIFTATDSLGNSAGTGLQTIRTSFASGSQVIPNLQSGTTINDFELFSIPLELTSGSPESVFDELGPYDPEVWRFFHWNASTQSYNEFPVSQAGIILPGRGYWVIISEPGSIAVGAGTAVRADQENPFIINLQPGWNQIGNPYLFSLDWGAVVAANQAAGNISTPLNLFTFNNGAYSQSSRLSAYQGGFVETTTAVQLIIPVNATPGSGGRSGSVAAERESLPVGGEIWEVGLHIAGQGLRSTVNGFGMHPDAVTGRDAYDVGTLPRLMEYIDIRFPHPESKPGGFARDVVAAADNYVWEFQVEASFGAGQATLQWSNSNLGAGGKYLYLLDLENQQTINMAATNRYSFRKTEAAHSFKIFFGDQEFMETNLEAKAFHLGSNYPNPFNNRTAITYSLPGNEESYNVSLDIINALGQKIATLVEESQPGGFYEVVWDKKDQQGRTVPSGIFFYRLSVNNNGENLYFDTKRMLIN